MKRNRAPLGASRLEPPSCGRFMLEISITAAHRVLGASTTRRRATPAPAIRMSRGASAGKTSTISKMGRSPSRSAKKKSTLGWKSLGAHGKLRDAEQPAIAQYTKKRAVSCHQLPVTARCH